MKVTQVYGFSAEEIEALSAAGKILGYLSTAYSTQSEDAKELYDTTKDLIAALRAVLSRS